MCCLAGGPTPSQPTFPTGRTLVFVLFQLKTGIRLMIALFIEIGEHFWVHLPLGRPAAPPFIGAVALLLEILIVVC